MCNRQSVLDLALLLNLFDQLPLCHPTSALLLFSTASHYMDKYRRLPYKGMHAELGMIYFRSKDLDSMMKETWDRTDEAMHKFAKKCAKAVGIRALPLRKAGACT